MVSYFLKIKKVIKLFGKAVKQEPKLLIGSLKKLSKLKEISLYKSSSPNLNKSETRASDKLLILSPMKIGKSSLKDAKLSSHFDSEDIQDKSEHNDTSTRQYIVDDKSQTEVQRVQQPQDFRQLNSIKKKSKYSKVKKIDN